MTEENGSRLTTQAEGLFSLIAGANGWISRREIARALGQKQMNPYQLEALDLLISQGRLQVEKAPRSGIVPYELRYRVRANSV